MTEAEMKAMFKENFKREREEKGLTHSDMARITGVGQKTFRQCEVTGAFTAKTLAAVCLGLDVDPWVLFLKEDQQ